MIYLPYKSTEFIGDFRELLPNKQSTLLAKQ